MATGISYANEVWNVCIGCTPIASGCVNCWAKRLHNQRFSAWYDNYWAGAPVQYNKPFSMVQLLPDRLDQPLHWRKPRTIFVNSMGDTFHKDVPFRFIDQMFGVMEIRPQHKFLLFTKRWERAAEFYEDLYRRLLPMTLPLPNVSLYFSASTQADVDEAGPILAEIPVAVRGYSLEPLLEPLHFRAQLDDICGWIDHVIVGCESGPNRRPCKIEWIESIVKLCSEAGVPVYVKQMEINGKVCSDPKNFPENLRVREMPK